MNTATKSRAERRREKRKQWLWFVGIWCASLATVSVLGYAIKFLMSLI